jgi:hypothetical protein
MNHLGLIQRGLHIENCLLGRLQYGVQPAKYGHRQDDIAIFATHIEIAQHIVRDPPDEVCNPV